LPFGANPLSPASAFAQDGAAGEKLDRVTLRNGKVVLGRITSESDTEVEMIVVFAGGIEAPTTYPKSEILQIEHDVVGGDPGKAAATPSRGMPQRNAPRSRGGDPEIPEGHAVIYHARLQGHLMGEPFEGIPYLYDSGRRWDVVSYTPIEKLVRDAISRGADAIILEVNLDSPGGFDGLFVTEGLAPIFEDAQSEGARIIFWVESAGQGAAFLPMLSPEIYFKPNGRLGGIGDLGDADFGDEEVTEKQISLRLGHAEGIAIQNGYEPALVRAMAREKNWLAVRWVGGQPQYIEHEPRSVDGDGWLVISDDGQGANKDESIFEGDDVLNIDASLAERLLFSKGTADSIGNLVAMLGVGRDYTVIKGRGDRHLQDWKSKVARASERLLSISRMMEEGGNTRGGTRQDIGRQIKALEEMRSLLTVYEEVLDPRGFNRAGIDVQIEALKQVIRDANSNGNRRNPRGGRGGRGG
jgi:hypothetical protein